MCILIVFLVLFSLTHGFEKPHDNNAEIFISTNSSFTYYTINRLVPNNTHCAKILTFKYDSSTSLRFISFNDEDTTNSDNFKYEQLVAVKNDFKLILLLFEDSIESNANDVTFTEYLIQVKLSKYKIFWNILTWLYKLHIGFMF